ncbi:dipeptidase [Lentilactobacillus kosonis]|uniref:Dipeptidase n=1 Tax=Lentilactobacillus kosonis TaxID=2810561 RepID=A0A401FJ08_9LACO|nr:C69 family dipeptidase [Lentilactobacillus kosonis]GAY72353.1 dipeptidase [Lentilactobacillus kosonis]
MHDSVSWENASTDGSTIIARNEDARTAWTKRFVVTPSTSNGVTSYVSKGNKFSITLPEEQQRYTSTPDWTDNDGTFGEDGINQSNVSMSATESATANKKVLRADPFIKNGISEDSMLDVVLPFIHSAKEGVNV